MKAALGRFLSNFTYPATPLFRGLTYNVSELPQLAAGSNGDKMDAEPKYSTNGWFSDLLRDDQLPLKYAGSLRAKQLSTVGKMIMLMILVTLLNAAALVICFSGYWSGSVCDLVGCVCCFDVRWHGRLAGI